MKPTAPLTGTENVIIVDFVAETSSDVEESEPAEVIDFPGTTHEGKEVAMAA